MGRKMLLVLRKSCFYTYWHNVNVKNYSLLYELSPQGWCKFDNRKRALSLVHIISQFLWFPGPLFVCCNKGITLPFERGHSLKTVSMSVISNPMGYLGVANSTTVARMRLY